MKIKFIISLFFIFGLTFIALPGNAEEGSIRYEFSDSSRAIMRVGRNQSLDMLIQQIYPRYEELWPKIRNEIISRNPHAFNRYTGRLIQGERIKLVTVRKIHEGAASYLSQVGKVGLINGSARVINKNGSERSLGANALIYEGDRINTYSDSFLVVNMIDGAQMRIKENSAIKVTEYKVKSGFEKGSTSVIDLIKGGLRKITGSIAANPLSVYRFHTGVMTIGVRGTDFVVKLCNGNDCTKSASRNDAGTLLHVVVLDGLITLEDEEGVQGELILGQYAVANSETKIIVDEAEPVPGMLIKEERDIFIQYPDEPLELKEKSFWPWLIGGALLGIGI